MQLTKHTDRALSVLMHLASIDRATTSKEISDCYNRSHNHLMQVVPKLVELGYTETSEGRGGWP